MSWEGYISARQRDPFGVDKVINTNFEFTANRLTQKPTVGSEFAWVIEIESSWLPNIQNPITKATGLIQFMPSTAKRLGTTVEELKGMTLSEQQLYVQKYFDGITKPADKVGDVYLMVFAPAFVGADDSKVIFAVGTKGWEQNPGLREHGDGPITAASVRSVGTPKSEMPSDTGKLPPAKGGSGKGSGKKPAGLPPIVQLLGMIVFAMLAKKKRR